jgi:hypothetical protein
MLFTIDLPLNQLVYTSFPNTGFKLVTSGQVPLRTQQIFLKQVVDRYRNAIKNQSPRFRAIYLLQIASEEWLFGWLYNDVRENLEHNADNHIPYFICYHLAEPLYAFRIEKVCACLQKGPVELSDRHSVAVSLEPLILKDLSLYKEARSGVVIPWEVRQQIYSSLEQGTLVDIFICVNQQEKVTEPVDPIQPQQQAVNDKNTDNHSLEQPLISVTQQQEIIERQEPAEPQKLATKNESTIDSSLLIDRNVILMIGMSLGAISIMVVMGFIYILLNTSSFVPNQPIQSPSHFNSEGVGSRE